MLGHYGQDFKMNNNNRKNFLGAEEVPIAKLITAKAEEDAKSDLE